MGTTGTQQKSGLPQIVKLDNGLKLAEQWVNNMTKTTAYEPKEEEMEARPQRLGLGAKVSRQAKFGPPNNPLERKLQAKLNSGKIKAAKSAKVSNPLVRDGGDNDSDDDEDLDSRTSAFTKKRAVDSKASLLQANKKKK